MWPTNWVWGVTSVTRRTHCTTVCMLAKWHASLWECCCCWLVGVASTCRLIESVNWQWNGSAIDKGLHTVVMVCPVSRLLLSNYQHVIFYCTTWYWNRNFVNPSICHTRVLWQNKWNYCQYFDTTQKGNPCSFLIPIVFGRRYPLQSIILTQVTHHSETLTLTIF